MSQYSVNLNAKLIYRFRIIKIIPQLASKKNVKVIKIVAPF